ncbi:Cell wall formation. Synthesis of cross-linked peptidoglycan from the lipid intermediates. The enzyme has a penicillin-insensitive transglycosylase N-terminal domain (formation of linear glycan strands) and a penicillin-sensitive transpeptidase C-terminal domain (cross-linking of the peptide subunits) [Vibrio sp. B1FLJ16]|uniref:penicillin-binding protein 1B n=1 Tax=Vibrio sp. B1FLJ16 TaxID=2751178 RepID=UPI0015F379CF|nr:penicillin-binding protein 1B [Vibrio sp. B1FLJ16]CAD7810686.1 Cell wall formation. Synthesis of cross-linked peptidoglycan from the lipid intermediates. The enzyme has a penicillin-insensitive transglycosylase N-terminal domain (formation of linear glycan strands) and a penicillin-sensitive transpeptidase C-terminal domain (cross-linking of the peptide subunits) [Vibrio sp. B1FLJ16]CAE6912968.1 Cell wall formation. Synthesis of cross-linked peptidoglycan from the lipid intermediates. The enzy
MTDTKKPRASKTPAKKKTATKAPAKRSKRTPGKKPSNNGKRSWLKVLWSITWKAGIALAAVLLFVGIYLDSVVKERFEGQLFELPTVVYARILNLSPGENISIQELRNELDVLNYRKVSNPRYPGEYSSSSTRIELIRRPFEFSDGPEPDRHVMLHFSDSGLQRIQSLESRGDLGYLRLEPKMLGMLEKDSNEQRLFLRRDQYPEILVDALLATEDRDFYQHDGVSPLAIARALVANIRAGRTVQGGSTLTQQLAKNLFLTKDKTLWRKIREAYIALILDYRYSKDRILEAYLNEVYLGQSGGEAIHGFGLASRYYFGQPIQELRIDQLAMLVGMVKGPSYYNPIRYPERTQDRRDLVLRLLMHQDMLTSKEYEQAASRPLDTQENPRIASRQPAYFQQLSIELKEKVGDKFKSETGLRVFTSLDPVSQSKMEQAIASKIPELAKLGGKELEAAAVAVDRHSGEIRAMVGGKRVGYEGFNRALNASRPIGSLVKPAIYLTALEQPDKYNLGTTLHDTPLSLKGSEGTVWTPRNYDRKYRGDVPLFEALAKSLNVPTVRLGMELGIPRVTSTLERLGVNKNEIRPVPSMFLGSFSLTPLEVAQMYQTLTNSGKRAKLTALRSVKDLEGNVLYQSLPRSSREVDEQAAWLTTYAMKQGVAQGTGRFLQNQFAWAALAGKTGTSNDTRDSWFVGVDGREVTTIWLGRDDNKPTNLTGSSGALRVYAEYLTQRIPERLELPWPREVTTLGFKQSADGGLEMNCRSEYKLPIWDKTGQMKQQCEKKSNWISNLFDW